MKHLITLSLLLVLSTTSSSQETWIKLYGGSKDDQGYSITGSEDGGWIVCGFTNSDDEIFAGKAKGDYDVFIMKLDSVGSIVWTTLLGGSKRDDPGRIINSADGGVVLCGSTTSDDGDYDVFVAKLNSDGSIDWDRVLEGTGDDYSWDLAPTNDGGYIIVGESNSTDGAYNVPIGRSTDGFYAKLDPTGNVSWLKLVGGSGYDGVWSLAIDDEGRCMISGFFDSNDGDFTGMEKGGGDIFFQRIDNLGALVWRKAFGGTGMDYLWDAGASLNGSFLLTGMSTSEDGDFTRGLRGLSDVFCLKINTLGDIEWLRVIGGTMGDEAICLSPTIDGGCFITGHTQSKDGDYSFVLPNYFNQDSDLDVFIMRLDNVGDIAFQKSLRGSWAEYSMAITEGTTNRFAITGMSGSTDFDFEGLRPDHFTEVLVYSFTTPCPVIISPAYSIQVYGGHQTSMSVTATSTETITYQWQRQDGSTWVDVSDGTDYGGSTSATLTIKQAKLSKKGPYRCAVSAGGCTLYSNEATLTVNCPCNE